MLIILKGLKNLRSQFSMILENNIHINPLAGGWNFHIHREGKERYRTDFWHMISCWIHNQQLISKSC